METIILIFQILFVLSALSIGVFIVKASLISWEIFSAKEDEKEALRAKYYKYETTSLRLILLTVVFFIIVAVLKNT